MPVELTVEDLKDGSARELGSSDWVLVDQTRIDRFATATEDRQWIHVDPARAREGPFGGTIAHGYLTLSLIPRLLGEIVHFPGQALIVNYGIDRLRFLHPVPAGAEVRLHGSLLAAAERPNGTLVRLRGEIEIRGDGARALVAELLYLVAPATSSA